MKYSIQIFKIIVFFLIIGGMVACGTDNGFMPKLEEKTTSVVLNVPQLEASVRSEGTDRENALKTLRVVILSENSKYSINRLFTEEELTNNTPLIIDKVPVGTVQMYAIANEKAVGRNYENLSTLQGDIVTLPDGKTKKILIKDLNHIYFPKRNIPEFINSQDGLPMSWMNKRLEIRPMTETPQVIDIELVRAVAKLYITMNNSMETTLYIGQMRLGGFFADRFYLFREENLTLDIPAETNYTPKSYNNMQIEIPAKGKKELILYMYPSHAWTSGPISPYTIGFTTTDGDTYHDLPFVENGNRLNSIVRNTQVNINATLTASNVHIAFSVEDWASAEVDVPSFN